MPANLTAAQTVEALIKLGTLITDKKGPTDWLAFLSSSDFQSIKDVVDQTAKDLDHNTIQATISTIIEKQQALLAKHGGKLVDLSTDELLQYADLGNLKLKLQGTQGANAGIAAFGGWLVNEAFPVLLQVAPVVIPLLL